MIPPGSSVSKEPARGSAASRFKIGWKEALMIGPSVEAPSGEAV
jgi:hypothetical protein